MREETTKTTRSEFHRPLDDLGKRPSIAVARVVHLLRLRPSLQALRPLRFLALSPPSQLIAVGDSA